MNEPISAATEVYNTWVSDREHDCLRVNGRLLTFDTATEAAKRCSAFEPGRQIPALIAAVKVALEAPREHPERNGAARWAVMLTPKQLLALESALHAMETL